MHAKFIRSSLLAVVLGVSLGAGATTPESVASPTAAQDGVVQKSAVVRSNASVVRSNASTPTRASPTTAQLNQSALVVMPPPILRNTGRVVLTPDKPLLGYLNLKSQSVHGLLAEAPPALQPPPYEAALSLGTGDTSSLRIP
jgi:hypothetical protein